MLTWSMFAPLKPASCASAGVPPAATSIARPRINSRRVSAPFSKRVTRLEMIDSIQTSSARDLHTLRCGPDRQPRRNGTTLPDGLFCIPLICPLASEDLRNRQTPLMTLIRQDPVTGFRIQRKRHLEGSDPGLR